MTETESETERAGAAATVSATSSASMGATVSATVDATAAVPSLRRRLSRFVLLLAMSWVALASTVLALWVRHEVFELLDDGLVATSEALAVVLAESATLPQVAAPARIVPAPAVAGSDEPASLAWQLLDAQGRMLMFSADAPQVPMLPGLAGSAGAARERTAHLADGIGGWRVRARPLADGRWLLVGQAGGERSEDSLEVAGGTVGVALLVSLLGLAWMRWRLARETQPLADLGRVLSAYDPMKPDARLPPPALQELAPVHEAVQQMGRRLAQHAAAEHAFSAHAAHALRTPLAGLEAQLAVAQREAPPALHARLARMRGAIGRLSHVVTALLALFRSGGEFKRAPVDVRALLVPVALEGLTLEVHGAEVRPAADADLLVAALINLLDNALRHGAHRVRVQVSAAHITLDDDGPGVSAERLLHLRQALQREAMGAPGHDQALAGLGLALADRVARAHGGRLELLAADSGFAVRLWLGPASSPTTAVATLAEPLPEPTAIGAPPMPDEQGPRKTQHA